MSLVLWLFLLILLYAELTNTILIGELKIASMTLLLQHLKIIRISMKHTVSGERLSFG